MEDVERAMLIRDKHQEILPGLEESTDNSVGIDKECGTGRSEDRLYLDLEALFDVHSTSENEVFYHLTH